MAFTPVSLTLWSNAQSPNSPRTLPQWWGYNTLDSMATVSAAGYFNTFPETLLQNTTFRISDFLYCACSDGILNLDVTALSPNITTGTASTVIPDGSITTAKLAANAVTAAKIANATITTTQISNTAGITGTQLAAATVAAANIVNGTITATQLAANAVTTAAILNANVTLAKLAAGITPSHVVKFAAQHTTTGGAAAEAIAVVGLLATDFPFVQLKVPGTNTVSVSFAVPTTDTLTVTFSGDPGADAVIYYQVLRAAS